MKALVSGLLALGLLAGSIAEAAAVTCAAGVYRAGCAGAHGAVVTRRPYAYPHATVYRPGRHCHYRNGVRVCT